MLAQARAVAYRTRSFAIIPSFCPVAVKAAPRALADRALTIVGDRSLRQDSQAEGAPPRAVTIPARCSIPVTKEAPSRVIAEWTVGM